VVKRNKSINPKIGFILSFTFLCFHSIRLRSIAVRHHHPPFTTAAAPADPTGTLVEALFRPSTRFRDTHPYPRGRLPEGWTDVELLPDLPVEHVLATGIMWEDLSRFLRTKIVWMARDV
jgi:hypothetical protein